jgi:hypothetical protein
MDGCGGSGSCDGGIRTGNVRRRFLDAGGRAETATATGLPERRRMTRGPTSCALRGPGPPCSDCDGESDSLSPRIFDGGSRVNGTTFLKLSLTAN